MPYRMGILSASVSRLMSVYVVRGQFAENDDSSGNTPKLTHETQMLNLRLLYAP